ncbi:MAG: diguanylate cyclase [Pseudomonadota bacterium]
MADDNVTQDSSFRGWQKEVSLEGHRILVADDDPVSRKILEKFLAEKGIDFLTARDGGEALELLDKNPRDLSLLLVDWMMPKHHGVDVIRAVRAGDEHPFLYCILLTSKDAKDDIVAGFQAGADDYVTKPYNKQELWARILTGLRIRQLMVSLERQNRLLSDLALKDPLTQLLNRRAMESILTTEVARASRFSKPICVGMGDIDHFKKVNDTYGHLSGDKVIKAIGEVLRQSTRTMDTVARYGGEEFVIILPESEEAGCRHVAERIRQEVEAMTTQADGSDQIIKVTISLGFVVGVPTDHETGVKLFLDKADQSLYEAKQSGRNRWIIKYV